MVNAGLIPATVTIGIRANYWAVAPPISISNVEIAQYNIQAGAKILRHIADTYYDPKLDA